MNNPKLARSAVEVVRARRRVFAAASSTGGFATVAILLAFVLTIADAVPVLGLLGPLLVGGFLISLIITVALLIEFVIRAARHQQRLHAVAEGREA